MALALYMVDAKNIPNMNDRRFAEFAEISRRFILVKLDRNTNHLITECHDSFEDSNEY